MANTQTTVPTFVPGQVLEATQLVNSAATGVPVFATTVTRDAGFGGAGEKTLAEGQLCYLESTNVVQYYDGAAWATLGPAAPAAAGGLTFITSAQVTAQSSSDHTGVFSSTYNNYLLLIENIQCSLDGYMLSLQYGTGSADTANSYVFSYIDANGANLNASGTAIKLVAADTTATESAAVFATIFSPNLATATGSTSICSARNGDQTAFTTFGSKQTTTQYTSLHFVADAGSTYSFRFTLYGYATS